MHGRGRTRAINICGCNRASLKRGFTTGVVVEERHDGVHPQVERTVRDRIAGSIPVLPQVALGVNPQSLQVSGPVYLLGGCGKLRLEIGLVEGAFSLARGGQH